MSRGFTLIELMIVVSIVAILSGLALENFQAARIRSVISRNKADFHALATGIEAYAVDHNAYPRMAHFNIYKDLSYDVIDGQEVKGVMSKVLSTPVAYLANAYCYDPFMVRAVKAPLDERLYTYQDLNAYAKVYTKSTFWKPAMRFYGAWRMGGVGPDQRFDHAFVRSGQLPYDPTNGLISLGNIWTSQHQNSSLPPIPELLGEH